MIRVPRAQRGRARAGAAVDDVASAFASALVFGIVTGNVNGFALVSVHVTVPPPESMPLLLVNANGNDSGCGNACANDSASAPGMVSA